MLRRAITFDATAYGASCCAWATPSWSSSSPSSYSLPVAQLATTPSAVTAARGLKTRKRPKVGSKYIKDAQQWRETYQSSQQRVLADSLRGYMGYGATRRMPPYDARFKPFDREEADGVYVVMRHLMKDKIAATRNHAPGMKRLFANVGLIGPQVTTTARWRGVRSTSLPEKAALYKEVHDRDKTLRNKWYSD